VRYATLLTVLLLVVASPAVAATKKPNILYIIADEWRGMSTGYNGDPNVKTPNLDKLAGEGLNYINAVSVNPVCTPYRAALMTGRFPTSTGMFLNDAYLPAEELCMAEIFAQAGYETAFIGKWHLDGNGRDAFTPRERRQGWDFWMALECTHDYNKSAYYEGDDSTKKYWEGYDAFAQTQAAQSYIKDKAKGDKPFVMVLSFGPPHFPTKTAPKDYQAMYPPEEIELPPNVPEGMKDGIRKVLQGYYGHCTAVDKCIGDLMGTLKEAGVADDTIIVFTSDHGDNLGSHGNPANQKQLPWDEAARVPFLVRYTAAGGPAGVRVKTPITTPDVLPTLLGLAGVQIPDSVEGTDLSKTVTDPAHAVDRVALYEAIAPFSLGSRENNRPYRAIRTQRYTYVRDLNGPWLLFDDQNDPFQTKNLVGQPEQAALQNQLDEKLMQQLQRLDDPFREARYYIDLWGFKNIPDGGSIDYGPKGLRQTPVRQKAE